MSARLRLALSYAAFLVVAGSVALFGFYMALHLGLGFKLQTSDVTSRGELRDAMLWASAGSLAGLAVVGLGGGWLLAGWILRPLEDINEAARIAATGRLDHRIRLADRSDEFGQLADNFDHMLERLHDAFLNQERFAANASHELRTPLAVTATMLDVAQAEPEGHYDPALLERLQSTNNRAIELTEALLRLSDANAVTAVFEPVDLAALAGAVFEDRDAEAKRRRVRLQANLEAAPSAGDPALLRQLVGNLVENALRHNRPEGEAWLSTHVDAASSRAVLRVENSGPAYTAEAAAQLVQPFLRGAGRTASENGDRGYGLGLALVARIVSVHDGDLSISPRAGGGLVATVALPLRGSNQIGQPRR
jgi:two-component system sensor histidine kinase VanS